MRLDVNLHRAVCERSKVPIALSRGKDHVVCYANPVFCRALGRPCAQIEGRRIATVFGEPEGLTELLDRAYRTCAAEVGANLSYTDAQGQPAHATFMMYPRVDEQAHALGLVVQVIDTTEVMAAGAHEARAREDLKQANEQLIVAGLREQELADQANASTAEVKALLHRESLLANASHLLASSLDFDETLQKIGHLLLPELADWCIVHLVRGDAIELAAGSHIDPRKARLLQELRPRLTKSAPRFGVRSVLRTGRPEVHHDIGDPAWVAEALQVAPSEVLSAVGTAAFICVPLRARDQTIGVLTLVASQSGRRFQPRDLEFAKELARRSSIALDNARLFQDAQVAIRLRDDVLAVVSHDLRNPVSSIMLNAAHLLVLTESEVPGSPFRRPAEVISRSAEHMRHLIDELVESATIRAGRLVLERSPVHFTALVDEALEMIEALAAQKSLVLNKRVMGYPFVVVCDKERILRVLGNLIGNAIKFTPEGGRIAVTIEYLGTELRVRVTDTGSGVAEADVARLFDPYWKGRRTGLQSTGLGLYIAKSIVQAHGGWIWVESEPGAGSSFYFTLPREPMVETRPSAP